MSSVLSSVPKGKHYAIIEKGSYSTTVDYGPPDRPYTEYCSYRDYQYFPDEESFRKELESRIKRNEKPGIDFIAILATPIQIETEVKIKIS